MYDPGGNSEDETGGDWCFLSENKRWKAVQTGDEKVESGAREVKPVGEYELGEEEVERGEQYEHKKELEGKPNCGVHLTKQGTTEELKLEEKREVRKWKVLGTTALTRNKAQLFPTTRRPEMRDLISEDEISSTEVEEWFASTALQLGTSLSDTERERAKRLLYTWRDVFETDLLRIRRTDLIEHAIILEPGAKPYRARIPLYTEEEINFCKRLLPEMEKAGLIFRCDSD